MSTPDIAPEPDDVLDPTDPVVEPSLEDAIAEQLSSGGEGAVPAADPDPPVDPEPDPEPVVDPAPVPDPFAPPVQANAPETINAWGLELTQDEFQTLIGAYQFAASLTADQIAQLRAADNPAPGDGTAGVPTAPAVPVAGMTADEWEDVDPAVRQTLAQQQTELATIRAQFEQSQQAQAAAQYRDLVQERIDQFGTKHGLGPEDTERVVTRLRDSGLLPAFVERAQGDVGRAVEEGLFTAMSTDPVYQQRLAATAAAQDAELAAKKQRAGGVAGTSGSSVSPLGGGARPGPAQAPPANATEARARRAAEAQEGLAAELRAALSSM